MSLTNFIKGHFASSRSNLPTKTVTIDGSDYVGVTDGGVRFDDMDDGGPVVGDFVVIVFESANMPSPPDVGASAIMDGSEDWIVARIRTGTASHQITFRHEDSE